MIKQPPLDERDHTLLTEIVGYLRGLACGTDSQYGDRVVRAPSILADRLEFLLHKMWPVK